MGEPTLDTIRLEFASECFSLISHPPYKHSSILYRFEPAQTPDLNLGPMPKALPPAAVTNRQSAGLVMALKVFTSLFYIVL